MTEATALQVNSILSRIKNSKDLEDHHMDSNDREQCASGKICVRKSPPRGLPKSGRFWKSKKEKFSTINKTKGLKQDFQKKTLLRLELQRTKELSKQVKEELKQKELAKKERRRENLKRTEENKRKAEVVQVITNTAKLKRMRKKQLRFIQKRDTNKDVEAAK